jgi:predicted amino acid racemase
MPELRIDVDAVGRNTEVVAAMLRARGVGLVAVTKACLGEPRVAAAMLAGGAAALADTRDANLRRLRSALPGVELHRIHLPSLTERFEPADVTYVSSREGARAVAALAAEPRRVMVLVETGDGREGVPPDSLVDLATDIADDRRLRLEGVATNYACFKGAPEWIGRSVETVARAACMLRAAGLAVERVSGGNSSLLHLVARGEDLPAEVTELRCGEALLLGHDALYYRPLPGCSTDACVLRAEVVEEYTKPAAGGAALRLVLGVGRQDLGSGAVRFTRPGLSEIGRSADYLVVEAERECSNVRVGTMLDVIPAYEALVAAWTSPYVELKLL